MSDDDDDEEDDVMDEKTAEELQRFIAEPGDEVNDEISHLFSCIRLFVSRKMMRMQMIHQILVNQKKI